MANGGFFKSLVGKIASSGPRATSGVKVKGAPMSKRHKGTGQQPDGYSGDRYSYTGHDSAQKQDRKL